MSRLPLWFIFLLSLAGYVVLALWFPLRPYYNQLPLADVRRIADSPAGGIVYALLLTALFVLLILAYRRVRAEAPAGSTSLWRLLGGGLLLALPLIFTFPINATDIYRYIIQGRITVIYEASPFAVAPAELADDPYAVLAGEWIDVTSPYGPVWELVAAGLTLLTGGGLWRGLLFFKALTLLAHLSVGIVIWQSTAGLPASGRAARTLLWLWNPALLLTFVMDAHNDALMLLWLALGYLLWQRDRPLPAFLMMCLAPLTKGIGLLPLPFFFVEMVRQLPPGRSRLRFIVGSVGGGLVLALLAFLPFGSPLDLVQRLLLEAADVGGFSPVTLLILLAQALGISVPVATVVTAGSILFVAIALWLLWRTWRGWPAGQAAGAVFAAYLYTAFAFRIWYTAWPFPWVLLPEKQRRGWLPAGLWLLYTAQLSVVIYGHLRYYALGGSQLAAHLVAVPLLFFPPLWLARPRRAA